MFEKPPQQPVPISEWASVFTWAWIVGLSVLGGLAAFVRKMKADHVRAWNFTELIGEIVISGLAGLVVANLCQWQDFPMPLTYALTGIGAHMGSRSLFKLEALLGAKFPITQIPKDPPNEG